MEPISRRDALALGAAALAAPALLRHRSTAAASPGAALAGHPFGLGVTSGDPDTSSVVLWTRLTAPDGAALGGGDVDVTWELADDDSFTTVSSTGTSTASAAAGHSVHAVADVAGPAWFRFRVGEWTSAAGRTAPTPADGSELRIASASCQHYESGFYAAHRDIAEWRPDLVVFLGDFIYEYGANPGGGVRSHNGDEVRTLDDYRARYSLYLGDADLRASRAAAPWLAVWDDHEVENNYAALVQEAPGEDGDFAARRLAAYQAWWEHMPVRMPRPSAVDDLSIYRSVDWGSLARIVLLDGRQYRSDQACGDVTLSFEPPCADALVPERSMLGAEQEAWLADQIATTSQTWTVLGQQTIVSDLRVAGAIINYDQWDGYGPARDRLLAAATAAERIVVLTGDIHLAAIGRLPGVGVEFITTSVSSTAPSLPAGFDVAVSDLFPDMLAAEFAHRGYTRHTVTPAQWIAEYRTVDDAADPASAVSTWKAFVVDAAAPDVVSEAV